MKGLSSSTFLTAGETRGLLLNNNNDDNNDNDDDDRGMVNEQDESSPNAATTTTTSSSTATAAAAARKPTIRTSYSSISEEDDHDHDQDTQHHHHHAASLSFQNQEEEYEDDEERASFLPSSLSSSSGYSSSLFYKSLANTLMFCSIITLAITALVTYRNQHSSATNTNTNVDYGITTKSTTTTSQQPQSSSAMPLLRSQTPTAPITMASSASSASSSSSPNNDDDITAKMKLFSTTITQSQSEPPLSYKSPSELGILTYHRTTSLPGKVFGSVQDGAKMGVPLPTNEWYLNLIVGLHDDDDDHDDDHENFAAEENRVYTIPYIVDTVGPVVGIRLHYPHVLSYGTVVQSDFVPWHGLTLGVANDDDGGGGGSGGGGGDGGFFTRRYVVDEETLPSKLGIGLRWEASSNRYMRTSILRGMPYGTMEYAPSSRDDDDDDDDDVGLTVTTPTIASEIAISPDRLPLIDGTKRMSFCGTLDPNSNRGNILAESSHDGGMMLVERDVELFFPESDLTWLVFFSRPALVRCYINEKKVGGAVSLPPGAKPSSVNRNAFQLRAYDYYPTTTIDDDDADDNNIDSRNNTMNDTTMDVTSRPLIVRVALANNCTLGTNVEFCQNREPRDQSSFEKVLRDHAHVYPTSPNVEYAFSDPEGGLSPEEEGAHEEEEGKSSAYLFFDWAAKRFGGEYRGQIQRKEEVEEEGESVSNELIMFALPHHVDILRGMDGTSSNEVIGGHCVHSLHGNACLVKGGLWAMEEELDGLPNFMAPRPPNHIAIPAIANALSKDIHYYLQDNYMRGAGDTYFSGKMLAKLGRIIVIAQELRGFAEAREKDVLEDDDGSTTTADEQELALIIRACKEATLPTQQEISDAIDRLRRGVEVWLNGKAQGSQYTFDDAWGGLVNCGCSWNGDGCDNVFPNCPGYTDPGLNFGNGHYNDHHFHYGYHIYAAAIVAQYDLDWGKRYFERVMLYIRDIANPSVKDGYFPAFRQKDWYLGNSWASGIALFGGRPYLNGRNQESSSEAIAAYEGIAMFGSVMMKSFGNGKSISPSDNENAHTACRIFNIGRFLAATEIRSADRYWHVYSPKRDTIYPDSYTPAVVSMMWDTMCQFQTWFGSAPYLAYGIQFLPLTPISERRDTDQWLRQLYPSFEESCASDVACINEGWAVLLYAVLATLGHSEMAMEKTLALPQDVFTSAGGSGHSLTNSLWYISTRPVPNVPYDLQYPSTSINSKVVTKSEKMKKIDCGCPDTCTSEVLSSRADGFALASDSNGFTCKERIQWLIKNKGVDELGACRQVAENEYKSECGECNPQLCGAGMDTAPVAEGCPPCNAHVCNSDIGQCQISTAPYVCYGGTGLGGCSATPWGTGDGALCSACCKLFKGCDVSTSPAPEVPEDVQHPPASMETEVAHESKKEMNIQADGSVLSGCPPCDAHVCNSEFNRCQVTSAPYLCYEGSSSGGCSASPWMTGGGENCIACCELYEGCEG